MGIKNSKYDDIIPFIKENQERFYRFAYRYMKNTDASIEVVQESIVKALEKIHTLKNKEYLKTWFYRILINECLSAIRKNKKIVYLEQYEEIQSSSDSLEDNLDKKITAEKVFEAIDNLPPKYKTIVILRFYEDMSLAEIANILKLNLNTAKTRLYRALDTLKIDLGEDEISSIQVFTKQEVKKEKCGI